ncbi:hypothetical protein GCM10025771_06950 [Niveibacterium umoris]|uniref:6-phosphogluconate dehydrogenase n=1 Tax=Niveibacterium umoris TaxID=1193620 RepID=A0A840BQL3_9RHOO|nr:hypothetical protein [Niveibacterium umoris]MBB4013759.1 hypothetical protein [Niveibacterium umoris]
MDTSRLPSRDVALRTMKKWIAILLIAAIGGAALYTYATLTFAYSDGERAGFVLKLSRKGWLCKTWEGELQMLAIPGALPEKFHFTVPDSAIAEKINGVLGKQVTLHYEEHIGIPSTCFGDTGYFVKDVEVIKQ